MHIETIQYMVNMINERSAWLMADYSPRLTPYTLMIDDHVSVCYSPTLTLKVVMPGNGYRNRQKWMIPEYRLNSVVRILAKDDAAFSQRLLHCRITRQDVERIILHATYNLVNPQLEE